MVNYESLPVAMYRVANKRNDLNKLQRRCNEPNIKLK